MKKISLTNQPQLHQPHIASRLDRRAMWREATRFFTLGILLLAVPLVARAQLQTDFGKNLLPQKQETPQPESAQLTIDTHLTNTYNNHIELGLSVDPYTSSLAGQENPQLEGLIQRAGLNLRAELPIAQRVRLNLQYAPEIENYTGAQGKLNEFDAFTDTFLTELSFQPTEKLPAIVATHQFQRLTRTSNVYNNTQRQLGIRFGRILEYQHHIHRFDDESSLREDFLLIGSTTHKATTRLQFSLAKQILAKTEYRLEHATYQTNLNNLILGVTGLADDEHRRDTRHLAAAKLLQVAADRLVFQQELNLFANRSNVNFFNFTSVETAVSTFYRLNTARSFRLRLSRLWVQFNGRQLHDETGLSPENASVRKNYRRDTQFGILAQANWQILPYLTLNAEYRFTQNRTNETEPLLDFLNYQHSIISVSLRGNY